MLPYNCARTYSPCFLVISLATSLLIGVAGQSWNYGCATVGTDEVLCTATITEGACPELNETADIYYENLVVEPLGVGPDFKLRWTHDNLQDYYVQLARFDHKRLCHVPDICVSVKPERTTHANNQRTSYQLTLPRAGVPSQVDVVWKIDVMPAPDGNGPIFAGYFCNADNTGKPVKRRRTRVLVHLLDGGKFAVQITDPPIWRPDVSEPSKFRVDLAYFRKKKYNYSSKKRKIAEERNDWNVHLDYDREYSIFQFVIVPDPYAEPYTPCWNTAESKRDCSETHLKGIVTTRPGCVSNVSHSTPSIPSESFTFAEEKSTKRLTLPTGPTTFFTGETSSNVTELTPPTVSLLKSQQPGSTDWQRTIFILAGVLGGLMAFAVFILVFKKLRRSHRNHAQPLSDGVLSRSVSHDSVNDTDSHTSFGSIRSLLTRPFKTKRRRSYEEKVRCDKSWDFARSSYTSNGTGLEHSV